MKSFLAVIASCGLMLAVAAIGENAWCASSHPVRIQSISLNTLPQADVILVKADTGIDRWNEFTFKNPNEIVVLDLYGCTYAGKMIPHDRNGRFVRLLRFGQHEDKVRIAANLEGQGDVQCRASRTSEGIALYIGRTDSVGTMANEESPNRKQPLRELESSPDIPSSKGESAARPWTENSIRDRLELQGKVWNKFAYDTEEDNPFEDEFSNHIKLRLGARYFFDENLYSIFSFDIDHFVYHEGGGRDYDHSFRFYDAFVNWSGPHFNLRVGNQIVRWGKTDGYSPLDNVNPEDLRDGLASRREERKIAIPMMNVELYQGTYGLQLIYILYFVRSDYDLFGTDWAVFDHYREQLGPFEVVEEKPPKNFENGEVGVRFSGIVRNLDYAISYLHSHEDIPSVISPGIPAGFPPTVSSASIRDLATLAAAAGEPIHLQHDYQDTFGLSFETTFHDFGVRGDFAYFYRTSFLTDRLKRIKKPLFQYVLGVDYAGPWATYFNLQFSQSVVQNYDNDIITAAEVTNAFNGTVSKEFLNGRLKPELRFFYDITEGASLLNPKLIIAYWDLFTLELGAEFYDGPEDTLLGLFRDNDEFYTILEIKF